jgi:BolA protein
LVKRHQLIYKEINEELEGPIHAISLHTFTDSEWKAKNETAQDSPDCLGGMKKEDS